MQESGTFIMAICARTNDAQPKASENNVRLFKAATVMKLLRKSGQTLLWEITRPVGVYLMCCHVLNCFHTKLLYPLQLSILYSIPVKYVCKIC